jgi:hypothetical protein
LRSPIEASQTPPPRATRFSPFSTTWWKQPGCDLRTDGSDRRDLNRFRDALGIERTTERRAPATVSRAPHSFTEFAVVNNADVDGDAFDSDAYFVDNYRDLRWDDAPSSTSVRARTSIRH